MLVEKITSFIQKTGLEISFSKFEQQGFLPGILIQNGTIVVNRDKLEYPGDLLHEAGHLAVTPALERPLLNGNLEPDNKQSSLELGAICWSYAALVRLRLDPKVVFHEAGYRGASDWYIEAFTSGNYLGLPLLQWMGLCKAQNDNSGLLPFPHMIKWLRD